MYKLLEREEHKSESWIQTISIRGSVNRPWSENLANRLDDRHKKIQRHPLFCLKIFPNSLRSMVEYLPIRPIHPRIYPIVIYDRNQSYSSSD